MKETWKRFEDELPPEDVFILLGWVDFKGMGGRVWPDAYSLFRDGDKDVPLGEVQWFLSNGESSFRRDPSNAETYPSHWMLLPKPPIDGTGSI